MGKTTREQLQLRDYRFDEASSGSDESDHSEDEDEHVWHQEESGRHNDDDDDNDDDDAMLKEKQPLGAKKRKGGLKKSRSDESSDDESESDGSGDDGTNDGSEALESKDDDDDESDQEENSSSDEEDAPLHRRVLKKEGRGSMQRSSRAERKSKALEEATKRLASFKETQKKKRSLVVTEARSQEKSSSSKTAVAAAKKKKKNKHKPTEVSSKRADFFARGARRLNESGLGVDIGAHRYKPMDPRASSLSGHFDEDRFHKNYAFLEELRNKEIGQVRKRIAAHKATGKKGNRLRKKMKMIDNNNDGSHSMTTTTLEEDVARLKVLTETRANLERRKIDRAAKQSVKRKIREDVESGKTGAYFLKRKERKRLELEARFEEIRKKGGEKAVEKMLAKKRQKNKSRDAGGFAK